ncbi:MAG: hypothetical protein JWO38_302 [Gemmataceae bacterium]|nr:hypothetical protein [Gemmataceae bacterium]
MRTNLSKLFLAVVVALALGFWTAPAAEAGWRTTQPTAATREPRTDAPQRDPVIGVLAIIAGVAVFVFLAWVAVRIGDSGR